MATFPQRLASFVAGVAARVEAIARRTAGPEQTRAVTVPGGAPARSTQHPDERTAEFLRSWEIFSGKVSSSAGPTRDRWALWNADDLTPIRIVSAQRNAVGSGIPYDWIELIDHIFSRDIDYASVTTQRVADVMRGRWTFRRRGNDEAAQIALSFSQEAQQRCERWRDGLGWLLYSNLYGYNAVETEWTIDRITIPGPRGDIIGPFEAALPRRLHTAHPKHFRFDLYTDDPLLWIGDGYQPLPYGKFIFMEGEGLHPIKARHGHAWQCMWMSLFTSLAIAGWSARVDRFDMPIPIVEYDGELAQYPEMKAAWNDILNTLGSGKGVVYPRNHGTLRVEAPPQGGRASDPQSALWDACKTAKVIRVLGAELANATGNVGSYAAKEQDVATKYNLEDWDAARLSERIDEQLTAPLIMFNAESLAAAAGAAGYNVRPDHLLRRVPFGKQSVPREMTPQVRAQVGATLINEWGMPISMSSEFDQFDFARAESEKDRLPGKAQAVGKDAALMTPSNAAEGAAVNRAPDTVAKAEQPQANTSPTDK